MSSVQALDTLLGGTPMYAAAAVTDGYVCSVPSGSVTMTGRGILGISQHLTNPH